MEAHHKKQRRCDDVNEGVAFLEVDTSAAVRGVVTVAASIGFVGSAALAGGLEVDATKVIGFVVI